MSARLVAALPGLGAFVVVTATAAANGGYFPTEWGWAALGFLIVVLMVALVRERIELGRREAALIAAFAALAGWVALSAVWSGTTGLPLLEGERTIVYVGAVAAALLVTSRRSAVALTAGVLAGISAVATYALATRLVPDRFGSFDSTNGYQLAAPIGYWNALGILLAIGVLLAIGFAANGAGAGGRALSAASLCLLAPALYFTFSRGATLALALGLLALLALDPRRLRLAALAAALAPLPLAAVWLCSREEALTREGARLSSAAHAGHRLAPVLVVVAVLEAAVALAFAYGEPRVRVGPRLRHAWTAVLVAVAVVVVAGALVKVGGPKKVLGGADDAFRAPIAQTGGDLNRRLLSFSGNGRSDYWRVAWHEARDHPLLGGGAGSFDRRWLRERPNAFGARDAHNLYLETLAEIGPIGLLLLGVALVLPLAAGWSARRLPCAPAAAAAYVAYLAHAGVDWDWEVTAVTLPALFCGCSLLAWARPELTGRAIGPLARAIAALAAIGVTAAVLVLHVGNVALADSRAALEGGDIPRAEAQASKAKRWAPWSALPWQALGAAELADADRAAARASFREAIDRDPRNWELWYGLALASNGAARRAALDRVRSLNPRASEADRVYENPVEGNAQVSPESGILVQDRK